MRDRTPEQEANIALLIDADNASPGPSRRSAAGARRARHDQHPPRLRQLGQGEPQGLGQADRHAFDRPDAAVRRRQRQERDRHAHDDRRDGPALSRQRRRLRDHVVGQRLPAPRPAHPRGRACTSTASARPRRPSPSSRPARASSTSARWPWTKRRSSSSPPPPRASARSIPSCSRCSASAYKASKRDEEGYTPLSELGQRAKAVSSFAARNYGFTRLSDLIKAVPNFEVKSGDDGRLLVKRLR